MRFSKQVLALAVLGLVLVTAPSLCNAQAILIDFDTDPSGNNIPAGFALDSVYSSYGLTFSHAGVQGGPCNGAYANSDHPGDFGSTPNTISSCPEPATSDFSEDNFGYLRMDTKDPAGSVCIDVRPNASSGSAVIKAYDGGGALIDSQSSPAGVNTTLCVTGRRIRTVDFSGSGTSLVRFDNLAITWQGLTPTSYYLPAAANIDGFGGAKWRTDLEIYNPNSWDIFGSIDNLPRNQANPSPHSVMLYIPAGQSGLWTNVLGSIFNFTGASTLRVTCDYGLLITTARSYNDADDGTYGQFIPGKTQSEATGPGQSARLIQLSQSMSDNTGNRTNIGVANVGNFTITVNIDLYDSFGVKIATITDTLLAFESVQFDKAFLPFISSDLDDGYAIVSSSTPEAVFLAFATPVDNRTGDGFYFPAFNWFR